jgi:hypothetical protein
LSCPSIPRDFTQQVLVDSGIVSGPYDQEGGQEVQEETGRGVGIEDDDAGAESREEVRDLSGFSALVVGEAAAGDA